MYVTALRETAKKSIISDIVSSHPPLSILRGDGDRDQLISASTVKEGIGCDGSGGGGDGHGRNAAAGGTHARYR